MEFITQNSSFIMVSMVSMVSMVAMLVFEHFPKFSKDRISTLYVVNYARGG